MLKSFEINQTRDTLFPSVEFYQMDLKNIVQRAAEFTSDKHELPSWAKFNEDPIMAQGFWSYMLQAMFEGKHNTPELHTSRQFKIRANDSQRVAMIFLGGINNDQLGEAASLAESALSGYRIVPVYGKTKKGFKGEQAEQHVKEQIERAKQDKKNVLIIAANMAQRSFSVPEITELYLAYDGGAEGATIQKMSRALTPDNSNPDKIGRIVSLSFDPNRNDKFDAMIIQTAANYNTKQDIRDMKKSIQYVLETVDIFFCQKQGSVKIEKDEYIQQLLARKTGLDRVIGKTVDMSKLTKEDIVALAGGSIEYARATKTEVADKGDTKEKAVPVKRKLTASEEKQWETQVAEAKKTIVAISENVDILVLGTRSGSVREALTFIKNNPEYAEYIATEFGVGYSTIDFLFRSGALNEDLLQLKWMY